MPRVMHEPWCDKHYDDADICSTAMNDFGPMRPGWPDGEPVSTGAISCERKGEEDPAIFIEYRSRGGLMDAHALRAVREAVADDPQLFLVVLDELIDKLGDTVPKARSVGMPESASASRGSEL